MILIPGVTRCPRCQKPVYLTDDLFAVQNWDPNPDEPIWDPGPYHFYCFQLTPFRDAYLAVQRQGWEAELTDNSDIWSCLARTADYALLLSAMLCEGRLYFLPQGRLVLLTKPEVLLLAAGALAPPEERPPTFADRLRWVKTQDGWSLLIRQLVPISAAFDPGDFSRLSRQLPRLNARPADTPLDLGMLCVTLGITPRQIDCPLAAARGYPFKTSEDGPNALKLLAERWVEITLTEADVEQVQQFFQQVLLAKG